MLGEKSLSEGESMTWNERSRMDKRVLLVGEYLKGERPMTELCREFGISRKSGYK